MNTSAPTWNDTTHFTPNLSLRNENNASTLRLMLLCNCRPYDAWKKQNTPPQQWKAPSASRPYRRRGHGRVRFITWSSSLGFYYNYSQPVVNYEGMVGSWWGRGGNRVVCKTNSLIYTALSRDLTDHSHYNLDKPRLDRFIRACVGV